MSRPGLRVWAGVLLLLSACPAPETTTRYLYEPYAGPEVFPSKRPMLPAVNGDLGLVSNAGDDTVTAIDLASGRVIGTVPVGRDPVDLDGPHHIAIDRRRGFAYLALSYPQAASALGPHAAHGGSARLGWVQKLRLSDLAIVGEAIVDANPGDIVLSEDGTRLAVSHFDLSRAQRGDAGADTRATLIVLDPLALGTPEQKEGVRIPVCAAPHGVVLSAPRGKEAFLACYGDDEIAVVDLDNPAAEVKHIKVSPDARRAPTPPAFGPYALGASPTFSTIAVANTESKDVRFFDPRTLSMTATALGTDGAPFFPAFSADETKLYIPTQLPDGVLVVDPKTQATLRQRRFAEGECRRPHEIVFGTDKTTAYLVCEGDQITPSVVLGLDADTLATRQTFSVGAYPDRMIIGRAP